MSNKNSKSKKNTKISSKQVNKKVTKNKSTSRIGYFFIYVSYISCYSI